MSNSEFNPTQVEILRSLYPIFKKEVYNRREQISQISRLGMGLFLGVILLSLFLPNQLGSTAVKLYGALGIILFAVLLIFQMREHRRRHVMAKEAVIEIEKALRLFEPGVFLSEKGLYPEDWRHYRGGTGEVTFLSLMVAFSALLAVLSLWTI